ncbi:hypothetical protein BJX64DRAFT_31589 [Aspergillus heterothallicus]
MMQIQYAARGGERISIAETKLNKLITVRRLIMRFRIPMTICVTNLLISPLETMVLLEFLLGARTFIRAQNEGTCFIREAAIDPLARISPTWFMIGI